MFRVGDEVRVKDDFWTIEDQNIAAPFSMHCYAGKTGVIEKEIVLFSEHEGYYYIHNMLNEKCKPWIFAKQWLELVPATEITEVTETEMLNMF